jgi:hypothetical protein
MSAITPICKLVARCARDDADGAADRIAPEQRALRTVQDFDAFDVEQILVGADRACEIDAVDIDADPGIQVEGEVILADATDGCRQHRVRT